MRKIICILLCVCFTSVCMTGCVTVNFGNTGISGNGKLERYEFTPGAFTAVNTDFQCNIEYYNEVSDKVVLDIQPNLLEYVTVETINGELVVRSSRSIYTTNGKTPVLTIKTPELTRVTVEGAATFVSHDTIKADDFRLDVSGAGDFTARLEVDSITVDVSGVATVNLSGTAGKAEITVGGAGDINALELQTREARLTLSGASLIKISCSDDLIINAGGVGDIEYRGNPRTDIDSDGMVSIRRVN